MIALAEWLVNHAWFCWMYRVGNLLLKRWCRCEAHEYYRTGRR